MSTPAQWIAREFEVVYGKLGKLYPEEQTAILIPGSRSIHELRKHIWDYDGPNWIQHAAYHLGEISLLVKVALAKRASLRPVTGRTMR